MDVVLDKEVAAVVDSPCPVFVRIIGVPSTCPDGIREPWRAVARLVANQLTARFGDQVIIKYHDLFSTEGLSWAERVDGNAPLVFVGDELLLAGDKVSVPVIRQRLESMGLQPGRSEKLRSV